MKAIKPGTGNGPKGGWADWRRRRDKAIAKPPKSRATERLEKVNRGKTAVDERPKGDSNVHG